MPSALEELPAPATAPLPGVREWQNPKNGFFVCEVHYTADPKKRTPEWKAQASRGMPKRGWLREYEIAWEIPEGEPVFPEYDSTSHRRVFPVLPEARCLRFWDFGHVCPVTLIAQLDLHGRLRILDEVLSPYTALPLHVQAVRARCLEHFGQPPHNPFDCGDPAGEAMTDLGSVRTELMRDGILLQTTPRTEGSYDALRRRLLGSVVTPQEGRGPSFLLHPRCKTLHTALAGGFHLSPKTGKPVDSHPYKDVCDALRYGNDNLLAGSSAFMEKARKMAVADRAW